MAAARPDADGGGGLRFRFVSSESTPARSRWAKSRYGRRVVARSVPPLKRAPLGSQRVVKQGQRQTVCGGSWGNLTTPQQPTVNSVIKTDYPRLPTVTPGQHKPTADRRWKLAGSDGMSGLEAPPWGGNCRKCLPLKGDQRTGSFKGWLLPLGHIQSHTRPEHCKKKKSLFILSAAAQGGRVG